MWYEVTGYEQMYPFMKIKRKAETQTTILVNKNMLSYTISIIVSIHCFVGQTHSLGARFFFLKINTKQPTFCDEIY